VDPLIYSMPVAGNRTGFTFESGAGASLRGDGVGNSPTTLTPLPTTHGEPKRESAPKELENEGKGKKDRRRGKKKSGNRAPRRHEDALSAGNGSSASTMGLTTSLSSGFSEMTGKPKVLAQTYYFPRAPAKILQVPGLKVQYGMREMSPGQLWSAASTFYWSFTIGANVILGACGWERPGTALVLSRGHSLSLPPDFGDPIVPSFLFETANDLPKYAIHSILLIGLGYNVQPGELADLTRQFYRVLKIDVVVDAIKSTNRRRTIVNFDNTETYLEGVVFGDRLALDVRDCLGGCTLLASEIESRGPVRLLEIRRRDWGCKRATECCYDRLVDESVDEQVRTEGRASVNLVTTAFHRMAGQPRDETERARAARAVTAAASDLNEPLLDVGSHANAVAVLIRMRADHDSMVSRTLSRIRVNKTRLIIALAFVTGLLLVSALWFTVDNRRRLQEVVFEQRWLLYLLILVPFILCLPTPNLCCNGRVEWRYTENPVEQV